MASGVAVSDNCVNAYNDLKQGRKFKYIFFRMSDDLKEIVVDKTGEPSLTYNDFINEIKSLPKEECRYAVFDFEWETSEGGKRQKIVFYTWCPDTAALKKKMLYSSSKDTIRKKLVGLGADVQGTDFSEIDYDNILDRLAKGPGNK